MLWVRILLRRGVLDITLCNKVCQWLAASWWFYPGTPVSFTNKTDHDISEILLKLALNTLTLTLISLYPIYTIPRLCNWRVLDFMMDVMDWSSAPYHFTSTWYHYRCNSRSYCPTFCDFIFFNGGGFYFQIVYC
jgi:hypothetical protein